jgi:hypothetical protein
MTPAQRTFAVLTSIGTLFLVVELVRRRRLKEEYSWLWIATSAGMLLLSSWYGLIEWVTHAIGAVTVTTTLFLCGLLFLLVISIHYSIVISRLTQQVRRLTQELAIASAQRESEAASRARVDAEEEAG